MLGIRHTYLQKTWNDEMDLIGFRPTIADEKEIHHWIPHISPTWPIRARNAYPLFFISSNGVPRHCTTSVNNGDTNTYQHRFQWIRRKQLTVIAHSNIGDNFLQYRLAFHKLLVLRLGSLKFSTEFLCTMYSYYVAW